MESEVDDTEENESEETVANDAEFDSDSEEESTEENSEEKEESTEENSEEETSASEKTDESFDQEEGVDETEDSDNVDMSENDAEEDEDGFWRKIKVTWVLDEEESQASSYDGKTPGVYLFRAKQKNSNYVVDEEELPTIQITVMEKGQETTVLEFVPLEETVAEQYLSIGSKESDIQLPEQLTVRETTGEETTERVLTGITWKLDAENSTYSEFQGGLALKDYFDHFTEDGEPEETEEKTWEGYEKVNEEYNGASYTYLPVIPETEEIPEETSLPEIHVQVGEAEIAVYSSRTGITGSGEEDDPYLVYSNEDWVTVTTQGPYSNSGNLQGCIRLEGDIEFDKLDAAVQDKTLNLSGKTVDGNGYSIKNLTKPLFGVANGTVKNLVLSGVSIEETSTGKHVGAIARAVTGALTVENCYVTGSTDSEAFIANRRNCAAGGLIGQVQSGSGSVTIKNCVVYANVENTGSNPDSLAGGLVGSVSNDNRLNIENCIAMGSVSTTSGKGAGGLVGGPNRMVTIHNSAALQKSVSTGSRSGCVGRIFGYSNDGKDYVMGDHNYAYADMTGGYKGDGKFPERSEHNGENAYKMDLLTTNFWNDTIGWAGNPNWTITDGQLPTLKTTNGDVIFSGADIPEYLETTGQITGTVTDGAESGIGGAEITFKKGSSEKTATTDADGTFQIDLANGTYDVTIKKIGYFTNTIQNVKIPGTLAFTLKVNPVSMDPDQTVTGTFQTTDAADVTAEGELALIYTGTEGLSADDFILSSEQDGNACDGIQIVGVDTSGEGTKLKIQFAKSLDLGNANEKTLYVHYKESLIGSFTLIRQVNAVQLAKPDGVKWDETVKGKAVWNPVPNAHVR